MKAIVVPTIDAKVRQMLRALGEPITLFGEREVCPPISCRIVGRL